MSRNNRSDLGKILKQRRLMASMTLSELATAADVSASHLGRIERGERYPSVRILRRLAKPLSIEEPELLSLAGYLSRPSSGAVDRTGHQVDPYVAVVLGQEPVEVQRAVVAVLSILKNMSKGFSDGSSRDK